MVIFVTLIKKKNLSICTHFANLHHFIINLLLETGPAPTRVYC